MNDGAKQEQPCLEGPAAQQGVRPGGIGSPDCTPGREAGVGRVCLGVLGGRYLHSVFAGHPWHASFSLKEETNNEKRSRRRALRQPKARPARLSPRTAGLGAWDS